MEHHIFAVWDFMTLLKSLQARLTCVTHPWFPTDDRLSRRLINEIVLGEESDEHPEGGYASHFELYLEAMSRLGADDKPIRQFLGQLQTGEDPATALDHAAAPAGVRPFVLWTLKTADLPAHQVAAAFTFGREELIPDLFRGVVSGLDARFPDRVSLFRKYLERHIDLDESLHAPLAFQMLATLCGEDSQKWEEARLTAHEALLQRKMLWDSILPALSPKRPRPTSAISSY